MDNARLIVDLAADKADDKKAEDIKIIDVTGVSMLADFYLICSGQTSVKTRAIAQNIEEELTNAGHRLYGIEGLRDGLWVLLDFGSVIVHVMRTEEREFYNLERLWSAGKVETFQPSVPASQA